MHAYHAIVSSVVLVCYFLYLQKYIHVYIHDTEQMNIHIYWNFNRLCCYLIVSHHAPKLVGPL
jgi:hypothetical protein